jgi:hypothetical protein
LGAAQRGGGEKGGAEQQVAAEGHGGEIQVRVKNFSLKSRKTSRKKILISFENHCQELPHRAATKRLFSPRHANPRVTDFTTARNAFSTRPTAAPGAQTMAEIHFFEDLTVGPTAQFSKTITEADILLFAAVTGDTNPMHLDAECAATSIFREPIAHGMLAT